MYRRYFRFGLRTLLGIVTACAIVGGWWADRVHRRQAAIRTIQAGGGSLTSESSRQSLIKLYHWPSDNRRTVVRRNWGEQILGHCPHWREQIAQDRQWGIFFAETRPLGPETFAAVASIGEVRNLGFYEGTLTDEGLARLAGLRNVESLTAIASPITDHAAPLLAQFQQLTWLNLDDTQLTDAAVPHLVKLQKLQVLRLQGTRLTDRGFVQLASLSNLSELSIGNTQRNPMRVSERGYDEVKRRLPNCQINGTFLAEWSRVHFFATGE
jgi:hypothetical protein